MSSRRILPYLRDSQAFLMNWKLASKRRHWAIIRSLPVRFEVASMASQSFTCKSHGLFAEDVNAVLHRADRVFLVEVAGQADVDEIKIRLALDEILVAGVGVQGSDVRLAAVADIDRDVVELELSGVDVADRNKLDVLLLLVLAGMAVAHAAKTENCRLQFPRNHDGSDAFLRFGRFGEPILPFRKSTAILMSPTGFSPHSRSIVRKPSNPTSRRAAR